MSPNTERALWEGRYWHCGQELNWSVGNCKVVQRSNALLVTKEISGKAKIDPMAGFDAMTLIRAQSASPPRRL